MELSVENSRLLEIWYKLLIDKGIASLEKLKYKKQSQEHGTQIEVGEYLKPLKPLYVGVEGLTQLTQYNVDEDITNYLASGGMAVDRLAGEVMLTGRQLEFIYVVSEQSNLDVKLIREMLDRVDLKDQRSELPTTITDEFCCEESKIITQLETTNIEKYGGYGQHIICKADGKVSEEGKEGVKVEETSTKREQASDAKDGLQYKGEDTTWDIVKAFKDEMASASTTQDEENDDTDTETLLSDKKDKSRRNSEASESQWSLVEREKD